MPVNKVHFAAQHVEMVETDSRAQLTAASAGLRLDPAAVAARRAARSDNLSVRAVGDVTITIGENLVLRAQQVLVTRPNGELHITIEK